MNRFYVEIDATSNYSADAPVLQVLVDGVVVDSYSVISGIGSQSFLLEYPSIDSFPSSLQFRFTDASAESGRNITLESVRVNGQMIDNSDLSQLVLSQGQASAFDTAANDHLFGRVDPSLSDLGTVTQSGTSGDDKIQGDIGDDVIDGGSGNDRIRGVHDDDAISGGAGNDTMFGEDGNDILLGGPGDDLIFGNDGDDLLYGGANNDTLIGGAGNDVLNGGAGNDYLIGNEGNDILYGEGGDDFLIGLAGDDFLYGDNGSDILAGGIGDDMLDGGQNDDFLYGESGADTIYGQDGDDFIVGGTGDDTIDGGADDDTLYGSDGADTIDGSDGDDFLSGGDDDDILDGGADNDVVSGGSGADTIDGGTGNDILHGHGLDEDDISQILRNNPNVTYDVASHSFYEFVSGPVTWDIARTNATASTINGVAGHLVTITSQAENDFIYQLGLDNGADNSTGASGNRVWLSGTDQVTDQAWVWADGLEAGLQFSSTATATNNLFENWGSGQPNNSGGAQIHTTFWYNGGGDDNAWDDRAASDGHNYVIEWEAGLFNDDNAIDTINGGDGDDHIYGYGGDDVLNGDDGQDLIFGGAGDDTINGGDGDDVLVGGLGSDTLNGGLGNDTIIGDAAVETLNGNDGDDTINSGAAGTSTNTVTLLSNDFTGPSTDSFTYTDGGFGGNDAAGIASGSTSTDGSLATGSLLIDLTGSNGSPYTNGSGSYDASITVGSENLFNVQISFAYRHIHRVQNDTGEDSEVYFEFEGNILDDVGGNSYISQALGSGGAVDTGWQTVIIELPELVAGQTYNLSMGIFQTGANKNNESSSVKFDDILIEGDEVTDGDITILNGADGLDILNGSDGGTDHFVFESASAFSDIDVINNFNLGDGDKLDISDLLSGYDPMSEAITDFVEITDSGSDSIVKVDTTGSGSFGAGTQIATITGVTGLTDEVNLEAISSLLV